MALQSGKFRQPADFGVSGGRKDANSRRRENQGKVGWCLALLESEWDVQKGPDPPKLEMPECCCTQFNKKLSTKPQRGIGASCRGERAPVGDWGLRRAWRPCQWEVGLRRRGVAARPVGEHRLQFTSFILN